MNIHSFAAELAQTDMGLFACAVLIVVCLGGAIASIVIEQAWLGIRRLWNLRKDRSDGR
ncbi:hypothetical protein ROW33_12880 [Stenotrophomonas maltophilia]|uniref:hypothetical protein n=1 Tax=Stenotrophomonas maltophilia TaxID=40324 RepID=UPI000A595A08|nr:hypothetical protein [Stenotrophomonas maltophilia]MBH1559991.1 hypothetical protein [Stenotrophomonas maltophilia]MDT3449561.1 hypothetical protein [Stenotrophomonas maltophilia]HEL4829536.1 hypothetical protein [Stenotrophomonas maltophilia]HEL5082202.1 hypothetical protein [Stenotrophomonas maltophilia]HEL5364270.1 hypothetical protein [Stenotrophomonas maltophilia]